MRIFTQTRQEQSFHSGVEINPLLTGVRDCPHHPVYPHRDFLTVLWQHPSFLETAVLSAVQHQPFCSWGVETFLPTSTTTFLGADCSRQHTRALLWHWQEWQCCLWTPQVTSHSTQIWLESFPLNSFPCLADGGAVWLQQNT